MRTEEAVRRLTDISRTILHRTENDARNFIAIEMGINALIALKYERQQLQGVGCVAEED